MRLYRPDRKGGFVTPQGKAFEPVDQKERNREYLDKMKKDIVNDAGVYDEDTRKRISTAIANDDIKNPYLFWELLKEGAKPSIDSGIHNPALEKNFYEYGTYNPKIGPPASPHEIAASQVFQENLKHEPEPELNEAELTQVLNNAAMPEVPTLPDPNQPVIRWPASTPMPPSPPRGVRDQGPPSMEEIIRLVNQAKAGKIKV